MTTTAAPETTRELQLPSLTAIRAERARRSLAVFFRYSWPVIERLTPLTWNWHLQAICDHVQALFEGRIPSRNLLINVPPGSSKSRIVSVTALAWWWIEHPGFSSIFSSRNPRVVTRDSLHTRTLITSQWYQESFAPTWSLTGDQNAKMLFKNTEGGFRQAIGSGAGVTGDRAHGLFMDDMLDAAEAESQAAHREFANWYDMAFANRLNSATGIRCMIGQRLHENDPAGHVQSKDTWEVLRIRQEHVVLERETPDDPQSKLAPRKPTSIGWRDPRTSDDELMDPVRFPPEYLAGEKRRLGTRAYAAQHNQEPAAASGTIIKRVWIQWCDTPGGVHADGTPTLAPREIVKALGITRVVQGVDTALGQKQENDYTDDCTLGEAIAKYYVLDNWMQKVDAPSGQDNIIALHAKWAANAVVIEGGSSASGKAAAQTIHAGTTLPVIELPVMTDKIVGLNAVAPTVEAGVVYFFRDQPWSHQLVESLCKFPAGAHDDDVDAFRIALWYCLFGGGATGMLDYMRAQQAKVAAAAQAKALAGKA